jgi:inosine/xanthosine triphosphate pyrophosphatase family protein
VVANDLFWNIVALRGFPGAYAKEVATVWFKPEDFLAIMAGKKDRAVSCTDTLVYYDGKKHKTFAYTYWGKIIQEPRGKGPSLMQVVVPEGQTKTIAEIEEQSASMFEGMDSVWTEFVKWYKVQKRLRLA